MITIGNIFVGFLLANGDKIFCYYNEHHMKLDITDKQQSTFIRKQCIETYDGFVGENFSGPYSSNDMLGYVIRFPNNKIIELNIDNGKFVCLFKQNGGVIENIVVFESQAPDILSTQ